MNANIRTIGGALGTAVVSCRGHRLRRRRRPAPESGFDAAFWVLTGASLAAAALALLVPAGRRPAAVPVVPLTEPAPVAAPVPAAAA